MTRACRRSVACSASATSSPAAPPCRRVTAPRSRAASSPAGPCSTCPPAERPTAIVAQSDVIAAGVVIAAEELGLSVPARPLGHGLRRGRPAVAAAPPHHDGPAGPREGPHPRHARATHPRGRPSAQRHPAGHPARGHDDRAPGALTAGGAPGRSGIPRRCVGAASAAQQKGHPTYLEELSYPCCIPALGEFGEVPPRGVPTTSVCRGGPPAETGPPGFLGDAGPPVASPTEDSHSGLVRTIGNRVGIKPSGVQIPHPPPKDMPPIAPSAVGGLSCGRALRSPPSPAVQVGEPSHAVQSPGDQPDDEPDGHAGRRRCPGPQQPAAGSSRRRAR